MERGDYIADAVHDAKRLEELRALPLERKIQISQARIIEWYNHYNGNVVVSFSGGKDSTVLLHLVRSIFPDVKAVFSNTGLEYPEIQKHVMSIDNVDIVRPSMRFDEVISTYGYPLIGKEVAEAIYYARRIRSQSLNVERESGATERRKRTELEGQRKRTDPATTSKESGRPSGYYRTVTKSVGGAERPSESGRNSPCQTAEESSHRDGNCKEQTNRFDGGNERRRDRAGVAVNSVTMGGVQNQPRMVELQSEDQTETRTQRIPSRDSTNWADWRRGCL